MLILLHGNIVVCADSWSNSASWATKKKQKKKKKKKENEYKKRVTIFLLHKTSS